MLSSSLRQAARLGTAIGGIALMLCLPSRVQAQQTATDSTRARMEMASQMMVPMMGQMMVVGMEAMLKALNKPDNVELLASFTRSYYDALVKKGFTKQEALQIVVRTGMPPMGMPAR